RRLMSGRGPEALANPWCCTPARAMAMTDEQWLVLKRASASRSSVPWRDDDYGVLGDGVIVGRGFLSLVAPTDTAGLWSLTHAHVSNRRPTHGYAATREEAMAAFAKSWRRER